MRRISPAQSDKIQILRGIAIIAVVLIHNTPTGTWQIFCKPFLNFAVGLFLFLSGMLSSSDKWNPKQRIIKVLIPYAIWTLAYVFLSNYKTLAAIPMSYIKSIICADSSAIMYYIFVYIQFTLLIPLIDKIARSRCKYLSFLIAPLEIVYLRLLPLFLNYRFSSVFSKIQNFSCLPWFTFFYLGYVLGNGYVKIKLNKVILTISLIASIAIQMLEGYAYNTLRNNSGGTQLKLSALLTSTIVLLIAYLFINSEKNFKCKPLKILGDYSFGIYFSHMAVMFFLKRIPYYKQFIIYPLNAIVVVIITFICCIIGKKILGKFSKYLAL